MSFGIYVHVPYCVQICPYCDFTKYELGKTLAPESYLSLLLTEIELRGPSVGPQPLDSLYFGGGTPSLMAPDFILTVIQSLSTAGFHVKHDTEITIEANPGTLSDSALELLMNNGINRVSVGAQTFHPDHLKALGRKHTVDDTRKTLELVRRSGVNFSFDLMFGLPHQTLDQLARDLDEVLQWDPPHVSLYCLTVPNGNPLARNRPSDDIQHTMFQMILRRLEDQLFERYEVSNFAKSGFRSRHNQLYWNDAPYWGLGVSSHSYLHRGPWGTRFWNPPQMESYRVQLLQEKEVRAQTRFSNSGDPFQFLPKNQVEALSLEEASTDYCHTSFRKADGILWATAQLKLGEAVTRTIRERLRDPKLEGLLEWHNDGCRLNRQGWVLADRVFETLTFLPGELTFPPSNS